MTLPEVTCTIDGREVALGQGWSANCSARGYDQARFSIPESDVRKLDIDQGSEVKFYAGDDEPFYEGRLASKPSLAEGIAECAATGYKAELEKDSERLMFQIRGAAEFQDGADEPFNFTTKEEIEATIKASSLWFRGDSTVSYASGDVHHLALWLPGAKISGYAMDRVISNTSSTWELRTQRYTGPSGTKTTITDHGLGTLSASISGSVSAGSQEDGLTIGMRANAAYSPTVNHRLRINNLRIYGIATTDTYTVQEVLSYLADMHGWTDEVSTALNLNCLPLDWQASHADLADYAVVLQDGWWRVCGTKLTAGKWSESRNWTTTLAKGARAELTPLEKFGQVQVNYRNTSGALRRVRSAQSSNGLANVYPVSLDDPQAGSTLAAAVAANLLPQVEVDAFFGTIHITEAVDDSGIRDIRQIRAGDTVTISDHDIGTSFTHRIHDVANGADGVVAATNWEASAAGLIARAGLRSQRQMQPHGRLKPDRPNIGGDLIYRNYGVHG
jgi:hypothetical protein